MRYKQQQRFAKCPHAENFIAEAEFNSDSDKVNVETVEPINEDEDENVPAETLSPS